MTPSLYAWHQRLARLGTSAKAGVLCGALLISLAPGLAMAFLLGGRDSAWAAIAAWAICLVAGLNGLIVSTFIQRTMGQSGALASMLAGMLVRMGLPLLLLVVMVVKSHSLLGSGFGYYLIGFYQVMLLVEVALVVPPANCTAAQR